MLKIEVSNLELCKEILETYTQCSSNTNASYDITQSICKKLNVPISENYCYISDLIKYLLQKTTIILDIRQVDLIMVIINNRYFDYSKTFMQYKFFRELMTTDVLPTELKNVRIDYIVNKIKESRGE